MRVLFAGLFTLVVTHGGLAWGQHVPVSLKGYDGKELTVDSTKPYSPRQTCGDCHDYDKITNGYHFQQGRTDGSGKIVMSDHFNPKKPWIRSAGMFGKW
jgi:hypothetical protein